MRETHLHHVFVEHACLFVGASSTAPSYERDRVAAIFAFARADLAKILAAGASTVNVRGAPLAELAMPVTPALLSELHWVQILTSPRSTNLLPELVQRALHLDGLRERVA